MRKSITAALFILSGCGGGEFESAPDMPGPEAEAGVEASPDSGPGTDALPEATPDVTPEATTDVGPEAAPEADAPNDTSPEPEPEAGVDAESEAEPEAGPEPQPEAGPDAEPEAGVDAALEAEAGQDAEAEAGQDAEAEAGFTCPTDTSRCVGLQPQECVVDHWENYGGICTKECGDPVNGRAGCAVSIDGMFDGPITEVVVPNADPLKVKVIGFKVEISTNLRWMYTPVITEHIHSTNDRNTFFTGTHNQASAFCAQAMMLNPAQDGWELPTLAQFQGIMSQEPPVNINERLVVISVFWGSLVPAPIPACHWTRDQGSPGTYKAVWAPAGVVYDTTDTTVCAAWCVKPNP
jgi:hypothetical protein